MLSIETGGDVSKLPLKVSVTKLVGNEDAAIDNTTRMRNDFFTFGYSGLFSFQTEKHPEGDDPEPVISKAHSLRI